MASETTCIPGQTEGVFTDEGETTYTWIVDGDPPGGNNAVDGVKPYCTVGIDPELGGMYPTRIIYNGEYAWAIYWKYENSWTLYRVKAKVGGYDILETLDAGSVWHELSANIKMNPALIPSYGETVYMLQAINQPACHKTFYNPAGSTLQIGTNGQPYGCNAPSGDCDSCHPINWQPLYNYCTAHAGEEFDLQVENHFFWVHRLVLISQTEPPEPPDGASGNTPVLFAATMLTVAAFMAGAILSPVLSAINAAGSAAGATRPKKKK